MGLNPSTLIMERDQDFPQLPSIPLSSKLDGALTPLSFPSTKAVTKSQSHVLAGLGSLWLGPRAAYNSSATLAQRSSQPFKAVLSSAHRTQESLSPCKQLRAFGFASRGNMFSLYPGIKQSNPAKTIQSTAQSMTSQGRGLPWS